MKSLKLKLYKLLWTSAVSSAMSNAAEYKTCIFVVGGAWIWKAFANNDFIIIMVRVNNMSSQNQNIEPQYISGLYATWVDIGEQKMFGWQKLQKKNIKIFMSYNFKNLVFKLFIKK